MSTPSSVSASFVSQLYLQFLRRPADAAGLDYWGQQLDSGALNAAQVSAQFMASTEFQRSVDPVVRLYFAAFGRSPDAAGLAYWVAAVHAGATLPQIAAVFAAAPEFRALHGAVNDAVFLDILYQQAFQRQPDPAGKAYFIDRLAHGASRGEVIVAFATSAELNAGLGATIKVIEQYLAVQQGLPDAAELAAGLASAGSAALFTKLYADDAYSGVAVPFLSRAGVVADGYIKGASVTLSWVETVDGVALTRTVTRLTDAAGKFDFGDQAGFGSLVHAGGIDISTGAAVNGNFRALAGSSVINPLTTLVHALVANGKHGAADAAAQVKASLGIDPALELGSYDPIAVLRRADSNGSAQAAALKVKATLAQIDTAMGQVGAVLRGLGVAGSDAGANAFIQALTNAIAAIGGSGATLDLASAATMAQLLKDAAAIAGASAAQLGLIAAIAADAGVVIANLNHAIADAGAAPGGSAVSHLLAIASVQVAAELIEAGMAAGAAGADLKPSAAAATGAALEQAIKSGAALVGDVDGDGKADGATAPTQPATGAPAAVVAQLAPEDDSGVGGDLITKNGAVTLQLGAIADGATVWIDRNGNGRFDANVDTRASVSGSSASVTANLAPGANLLSVYQQDAKGNVSPASSLTVVRDDTAPSAAPLAPVTLALVAANVAAYSAGDKITLHFSEAVNAAAVLEGSLSVSGGHSLGAGMTFTTASAPGGYATAFTITLGANPGVAPGDTLSFIPAQVMDVAGNLASGAASVSFSVPPVPDRLAPDAPLVSLSTDSGVSSSDRITQSAALTIANPELNATMAYSLNGGLSWLDLAGYSTATAADGNYTVQVRQTDLAGNHSIASAPLAFSKDATAPARHASTPVTQAQLGASDGNYSPADTITLRFSEAVASAAVLAGTLAVSGGHALGGAGMSFGASDEVGGYATTFVITLGAGASVVAGDTVMLTPAQITDKAGNAAASAASVTFTLPAVPDEVAPPTPQVSLSTDSGASGSDRITTSAALTISNPEASAVIEYSLNGGSTWISASAYTAATTADGNYTVQVRQTDLAGNHSPSSLALAISKDTTAAGTDSPTPTTQVQLSTSDGDYSGGDQVTISFSEAVRVADIVNHGGAFSGGHVVAGAGYSGWVPNSAVDGFARSFTLTLGANSTVVAGDTVSFSSGIAIDRAGNGNPALISFTLPAVPDLKAPDAPLVSLSNDSGAFASDQISKSTALTISNQETNASIEYTLNAGATWLSQPAYTGATASDGAYTVQVRQTDLAGNHSPSSSALTFTKDATAAAAASIAATTGSYSAGKTITISFDSAIDVAALTAAAISTSGGHSLGTGAALSAVGAVNGHASQFTLTLGTAPTLVAGDTLSFARTALADIAGNLPAANITFVAPDITAPVFNAAASSPADNGATSALDANIILQFSEAISQTNPQRDEMLLKDSLGVTVPSTITIVGSTIVVNPNPSLVLGEVYHMVWSGNAVKDAAGNGADFISDAVTYNFTAAGPVSGTVAQVNALSDAQLNIATKVTVSDTAANLSAANFNTGKLNYQKTHAERVITLAETDFNIDNSIVITIRGTPYTFVLGNYADMAEVLGLLRGDVILNEGGPFTTSTVTIVGNTLHLAASLGLGADASMGLSASDTATQSYRQLFDSTVATAPMQTLYLVNQDAAPALIAANELDGRALDFSGVFVVGDTVAQINNLGLIDSGRLSGTIPAYSLVIDTAAQLVSGGVLTPGFATIASYELAGVRITDTALSVADAKAVYDAVVAGYVSHNHAVPTLYMTYDLNDTALNFHNAETNGMLDANSPLALQKAGKFTVTGSTGDQSITGSAGADRIEMGAGDDIVHGGAGTDTLYGDDAANAAAQGNDTLYGDAERDFIYGGGNTSAASGDTLAGGAGSDVLWGDSADNTGITRGLDVFKYLGTDLASLAAESGATSLARDFIMDAQVGETLDFASFVGARDASHFQFFGSAAFGGVGTTGSAMQLRYAPNQTVANYDANGTVTGTVVYIDVSDDGVFDGVADMQIVLVGSNINLTLGANGSLIVA